jgi:heme/copper-type cytochrome/quinol oxidase subunit 2
VNLIQIKLIKVISKIKNILNQEFEQWKESQLIEVMKMKMYLIQFVSIVNLIQMKLMKVIYNRKNKKDQECEQWKESQLIEVTILKIQQI